MRWILIVFVGAVVGLCLVCGRESETARARRDAVEIARPLSGVALADRGDSGSPEADVTGAEPDDAQEDKSELPPEDPVEEGDCSLFLSLTSLETGAAVESRVSLYRLGAPGNEHWLPGDQGQAHVKVPKEGVWIHRLPEGRYRVHASAQRHPSDDPFRFSLRGAVTEKQLALPMPREFHARLVIVDERGQPVRDAVRRMGFSSRHRREVAIPWLRERRLRHPERYSEVFRGGGAGRMGGRRRWTDVRAVDGAFDLGHFVEDPRSSRSSMPWRFRVEDRTEIRVRQRREPGRDQTWMAISVSPGAIEDTIRLPDGRRATDASISMYSDAVLVPDPEPSGFWRTLTVHVEVRLEGYRDLDFEVAPGKPLEIRNLKPIPVGAEGGWEKIGTK